MFRLVVLLYFDLLRLLLIVCTKFSDFKEVKFIKRVLILAFLKENRYTVLAYSIQIYVIAYQFLVLTLNLLKLVHTIKSRLKVGLTVEHLREYIGHQFTLAWSLMDELGKHGVISCNEHL